MTESLIAYLVTIGAIVALVIVAAVLAGMGKLTEAVGVGAAVTGLIGVLTHPRAENGQ